MYNNAGFGEQAGGFVNSPNQFSSQNLSPGGGAKKEFPRTRNVVPVTIQQLLEAEDDTVKIGDIGAHMVSFVGRITKIERASTKTTYTVDDNTGSIDVAKWLEEGAESADDFMEEQQCRVIGGLRSRENKHHVMCYKISVVTDPMQVTAHTLEITHAILKAKALQNKMKNPDGQTVSGNSKMGAAGGIIEGLSHLQQMVYTTVHSCMDDDGTHREDIYSTFRNRINIAQINEILEFLSSEGHIYSTCDDDHYKATDS